MALTDKQKAFVDAYVESLNATDAARRAGYQGTYESLRVIGSQNLTKKHVREAIDRKLETRTLHSNEVLSRLGDQARGIPADCFKVYGNEDDGYRIGVDFDKLREYGLMHLIKKLSYDRDGRPVVEFYDAQSALVHVGRAFGLFKDGLDLTSGGKPLDQAIVIVKMDVDEL